MLFILMLLILFLLSIIFILINKLKTKVEIDNEIVEKNKELQENIIKLHQEEKILKEKKDSYEENLKIFKEQNENIKNISKDAFTNYCEILDNEYNIAEEEFDKNISLLKQKYKNNQDTYLEEINDIKERLNQLKNTYTAAIKIKKQEEEEENKINFYKISISDNEIYDIQLLEKIKKDLKQPRILSMLIWSTFFQKPMNKLCADVIGIGAAAGIYKITNLKTKECYIGQSLDIATRWKQHAKCGLGIDTPINNKLYKNMQEYGLQNFSWEVIEKCEKSELNQKEKFYINLYSSVEFGLNGNNGIAKS